ncbi:K(+)/H(+) antiporter NhaP [Granulosicoccus antarcticus IMCC3135]|uniref:K(+)/H(+) antiporter NhaP n=2 Tax=Granulosicoccus TaxID=437504 RepID=A0A2Z2P0N5_9GAMM|nr:K(+)/H(+) antiporter NhaP [Granulosicoccus antarcticus IMCC3135]
MIAIASVGALGGLCQWLAWKFKLPSILFLLTAGILVGPVFGIFNPDEFLGDLLFPIVSIFVAIILFEGGLTLKLKDIRGHGRVVRLLISIGVILTWLLIATTVHYLFDMSWSLALVFGSITVVSGPTVVKPLLRAVRPSDKVAHILHWEGILIDPVGVFLALLVFSFVVLDAPDVGFAHISIILIKLVVIGGGIGLAAGAATALVLRRYLVPDYLVNVLTLVTVVCAFVLSETLQHESGLLAVTLMGVWLANARGLHIDEILHFKEDLSVLLISSLFILLASRVDISVIPQYGWQILALLVIIQLVIRPLNAWMCTIGSGLSYSERAFIGWLSPRGIVAAAVSSVFVLRLQELEIPMAELLVPLTFSVIIGTVVFQSLTAKPLADKLGISNPEPNGVLFIGANEIAVKLATALSEHSITVMLSDSSWRNVREARQAGLPAYHGNATSGHASENLELQGIGKMVAVSANRDSNALASMHFRSEFGSSLVFTLEGTSEDEAYERFDTANRNRANPLFDASLSYGGLSKRLRNGEIKHLTIPENVDKVVTPAVTEDAEPEEENRTDASPEDNEKNLGTAEPETEKGKIATDPYNTDHEDPAIGSKIIDTVDETLSAAVDGVAGEEDEDEDVPAEPETMSEPLYNDDDLKLFAIDKDGQLYIYGAGERITLKAGWTLIVLSPNKN